MGLWSKEDWSSGGDRLDGGAVVVRPPQPRLPIRSSSRHVSLPCVHSPGPLRAAVSQAHGLQGLLRGGVQSGQHLHHAGQQLIQAVEMARLAVGVLGCLSGACACPSCMVLCRRMEYNPGASPKSSETSQISHTEHTEVTGGIHAENPPVSLRCLSLGGAQRAALVRGLGAPPDDQSLSRPALLGRACRAVGD